MKHIVKGIALIVAMVSSSAQAIPTLFFDGNINFSVGSNGGALDVSGVLVDTQDITPGPLTTGSSIDFSALLVNFESIAGTGFFGVDSTKGNFIGSGFANDLEIYDGSNNLLLTADFDSLSLEGADGGNKGEVIGLLNATGGSLMSMFNGGNLFALQLNLTTIFSNSMYETDFSGYVDGNIQGQFVNVPEPGIFALLSLGFLLVTFARNRKHSL